MAWPLYFKDYVRIEGLVLGLKVFSILAGTFYSNLFQLACGVLINSRYVSLTFLCFQASLLSCHKCWPKTHPNPMAWPLYLRTISVGLSYFGTRSIFSLFIFYLGGDFLFKSVLAHLWCAMHWTFAYKTYSTNRNVDGLMVKLEWGAYWPCLNSAKELTMPMDSNQF